MENEEKREHECHEDCGCAACAQDQGAHHHVHGHESGCGCAACHAVDDIFSENEEDEKKAQSEFRREATFLAVAGAVFVPTLICEALFPDVAPEWLFNAVFAVLYLLTGVPVLKIALKALLRGDVFNEFTLMGGATLAALAIGEMSESVGVMLFYRLGEAFQERASSNSRRSIRALLAQKPMTARVVTEDGTRKWEIPTSHTTVRTVRYTAV